MLSSLPLISSIILIYDIHLHLDQNVDSLPGPLVLLAANVGDGWVPLGPTAAKTGRKVATVFEDPSGESSDIEIFRTHTHELMIKGAGFNKLTRPIIDPPSVRLQ